MALTLAVIVFNRPQSEWLILICTGIFLSLLYAFADYPGRTRGDGFKQLVRWVFLAFTCGIFVVGWGGLWWPRLIVSPQTVTFDRVNETFRFRLKNETAVDQYSVNEVFHLKGDDPENTLKMGIEGVPSLHAKDGTFIPEVIGFLATNESGEKVLVAVRNQLAPSQEVWVDVTYTGNKSAVLTADRPISWPDPAGEVNHFVNENTVESEKEFRAPFSIKSLRLITALKPGEYPR